MWLVHLYAVHQVLFCLGIYYAGRFNFVKMKEEVTKRERLESVKSDFEVWSNGYGPGFWLVPWAEECRKGSLQRQKENFAVYLSGSCTGIQSLLCPSIFSRGRILYLKTEWFLISYATLRAICAMPFNGDYFTMFHNLYFWGATLMLLAAFVLGINIGWYESFGIAARTIRRECQAVDTEKGGDSREELGWWIENILKEETDSDALALERMEVVIAPIIDGIRCSFKENQGPDGCLP
jgi:hypothetical protein